MKVSEYDRFVQNSDQFRERPHEERLDIASYGIAAEIGSVVSAIKKRLLSEGGVEEWNFANEEIIEELGDVIWYCFSLSSIVNSKKPVNIFNHDIANLKQEISANDARADRIRFILDPSKRTDFLRAAEKFPKRTKDMEFEDYQDIAFLTARTQDRTLVEVCLSVLLQLSAQLFRRKLPDIERELNRAIIERSHNDILGDIAWHVSALASIYKLRLSDVAQKNKEKVSYRLNRGHPTPLHDEDYPATEQIPRQMEISFVAVAKGRSRMYFDAHRLGDDLTDNAYYDDGYRFHDIMHLAMAAKLGWSPVLRALLGRKRKSNAQVDQVEDGARAKIVEEAVIKAIHSEGERLARLRGRKPTNGPERLFPSSSEITFKFLKFIHEFVIDLEVEKNRYWEWEDAIMAGFDVFQKLRCEEQGTVVIDLNSRSLEFRPEVYVDIAGKLVGLGSVYLDAKTFERFDEKMTNAQGVLIRRGERMRLTAQKLAILSALDITRPSSFHFKNLNVKEIYGKGIGVKATKSVQRAMWDRSVITFRTTVASFGPDELYCTAAAVADE